MEFPLPRVAYNVTSRKLTTMFIRSAGSRSRLLIAIRGIDIKFRRDINEKRPGVLSGKEGMDMRGPDRVPLRALSFTNAHPFLFSFENRF